MKRVLNREQLAAIRDWVAVPILAVCFLIYGYQRFAAGSTISSEAEVELRSRIMSLSAAWDFGGVTFPSFPAQSVRTGDTAELSFDSLSLIIMLSVQACNSCQVRELAHLDSLMTELPDLRFAGIYLDPSVPLPSARIAAVQLQRSTGTQLDIHVTDSPVLEDFIRTVKAPVVMLVAGNRVVSTFKPVPDDDVLSAAFYRTIRSRFSSRGDSELATITIDSLEFRRADRVISWPEVRSMEGKRFRLDTLLNSRAVVNFWATWCAPCIVELPSLQRLARAAEKRDRKSVVALAVDDSATVALFTSRRAHLDIPIYLITKESADDLTSGVLPTTFVVDFRRVARFSGAARWDSPEMIRFLSSKSQL